MWSDLAGAVLVIVLGALLRNRLPKSRRAQLRIAAASFGLMAVGCFALGLAILLLPGHLNLAANNGGPPTTKDFVIVVAMMVGFGLTFVFFAIFSLMQDSPFVQRLASRRWARWT